MPERHLKCAECHAPMRAKMYQRFCSNKCSARFHARESKKQPPDERFAEAMARAGGVVPARFEDITRREAQRLQIVIGARVPA